MLFRGRHMVSAVEFAGALLEALAGPIINVLQKAKRAKYC